MAEIARHYYQVFFAISHHSFTDFLEGKGNMAEERKMVRSADKMIAGVCGGLAEYLNIDVVLIRVAFVLLGLAGGPGILLYIILWVVMPEA